MVLSIALIGINHATSKYKMMSLSTQVANDYVLKTINDPVILIGNDLLIKIANSAALDLTGFEEKELKGLPISMFIADTELNQIAIQRLINSGSVKNIEVGLMTKSKTSIPCLFSGSFIHNELGDVLGIACIFHDITDRKNYENILINAHHEMEVKVYERTKELEEINTLLEEEIHERMVAEEGLISSEEKFRALIKQSSDGILVLDQYTCKLVENNAVANSILGLTQEQICELICRQSINAYNEELRIAIDNIIEKKTKLIKKSIKYTQKNGTSRNLEFSATLVGFSNKQFIMITLRDITDELIMEERKQQMVKMEALGTLSGGIAHDFNNILAGIMGYTQLTLEELEEGIITSDNLLEVLKLGERAKKLISQILAFSKKTLISPDNVDLRIIIEDVLKMLKATLPAYIEIEYRRGEDSYNVFADQGELHQLVMNLCVNAELAISKTGGILKVVLSRITLQKEKEMDINY
jgi:PAS domain S-box-containing protein